MENRRRQARPERVIALTFAAGITLGTAILALPIANAEGEWTAPIDALFTATSAVCVTGLTTVDTATYWSPFGQGVIALLIQVGGLGIMTLATLIAVIFFRRLGLGTRSTLQKEVKSLSAADLKRIVSGEATQGSCGHTLRRQQDSKKAWRHRGRRAAARYPGLYVL